MAIAARIYGRIFLVQTRTPNVYTVAKLLKNPIYTYRKQEKEHSLENVAMVVSRGGFV